MVVHLYQDGEPGSGGSQPHFPQPTAHLLSGTLGGVGMCVRVIMGHATTLTYRPEVGKPAVSLRR